MFSPLGSNQQAVRPQVPIKEVQPPDRQTSAPAAQERPNERKRSEQDQIDIGGQKHELTLSEEC
jgi:hypothetical protein